MLKTRIITASLLIPIVVVLVLWLPPIPFAIISGLFFLVGSFEWARLAGFESLPSQIFCLFAMPIFIFLLLCLLDWLGKSVLSIGLMVIVLGFWSLAALLVYLYPRGSKLLSQKSTGFVMGGLVLLPAWLLLQAIHYERPTFALYILVLVWGADIGAYFAGKRFGKQKLMPMVSPGKTVEGAIGALIASLLIALCAYWLLKDDINFSSFEWVCLSLITAIFSIVGDLFESLFKRIRNVKDSGQLLPGHGGMLDRIDSLTAAIPIFAVGMMLLG